MMIKSLKKIWKGEEKLWKVFWLWGVLGNVAVIYISIALMPSGVFRALIYAPTQLSEAKSMIIFLLYAPISFFLIYKNLKNGIITLRAIVGITSTLVIFVYLTIFGFFFFPEIVIEIHNLYFSN